MAVAKVSLSLDAELLAQARERVGRRELSGYVNEALRRKLAHDRLGDLIDQLEAEHGPIPEEMVEEARQELWHTKPERRRRRPA